MKKICVYKCITGNYDVLEELQYKEKNIDYFCFTNNELLTSNTWTIKYIQEDLDNFTLSRKVKVLFFEYLNEYDVTIYIDGSIQMLKPITDFLNDTCDLSKYDMIAFKHHERDCIYDEINANAFLGKDHLENLTDIDCFLRKENYPEHNGLIEAGVLVRKKTDDVCCLMRDWFNMLLKYSRRDQLSFNYCLWKRPIKINFLDLHVSDNEYFKNKWHKKTTQNKKMSVYYFDVPEDVNDFSKYTIHNLSEINYENNSLKKGFEIKILKNCQEIIIILKDEVYSEIIYEEYPPDISVNGSYYLIKDKKYLHNNPTITLKGDFTKDDILTVKLDLRETEASDLLTLMNNEIYDLSVCINEIFNSTSWRATKPIRRIMDIIKK